MEIEEESSAVFSCELSHDDEDVEWFLNGTLLYTNNFNDIRNVGNCYMLTMKQVKPEDAGTVTMKSDKVSERARLKVIGASWSHPPEPKLEMQRSYYLPYPCGNPARKLHLSGAE